MDTCEGLYRDNIEEPPLMRVKLLAEGYERDVEPIPVTFLLEGKRAGDCKSPDEWI
jgi:hypothetical protein